MPLQNPPMLRRVLPNLLSVQLLLSPTRQQLELARTATSLNKDSGARHNVRQATRQIFHGCNATRETSAPPVSLVRRGRGSRPIRANIGGPLEPRAKHQLSPTRPQAALVKVVTNLGQESGVKHSASLATHRLQSGCSAMLES